MQISLQPLSPLIFNQFTTKYNPLTVSFDQLPGISSANIVWMATLPPLGCRLCPPNRCFQFLAENPDLTLITLSTPCDCDPSHTLADHPPPLLQADGIDRCQYRYGTGLAGSLCLLFHADDSPWSPRSRCTTPQCNAEYRFHRLTPIALPSLPQMPSSSTTPGPCRVGPASGSSSAALADLGRERFGNPFATRAERAIAIKEVAELLQMPNLRVNDSYTVPGTTDWMGIVHIEALRRWYNHYSGSSGALSTLRNHIGAVRRWTTQCAASRGTYNTQKHLLASGPPEREEEKRLYEKVEVLGTLLWIFAAGEQERANIAQGTAPDVLRNNSAQWTWSEVDTKMKSHFGNR